MNENAMSTQTFRTVRVAWYTPDDSYAPVFTGYADDHVWGGGISVAFARDEAERLVNWQNDMHARDPEGYIDGFSRTTDGGYRVYPTDEPGQSYPVPTAEVPDVGTVYYLGEGWTWGEVDEPIVSRRVHPSRATAPTA